MLFLFLVSEEIHSNYVLLLCPRIDYLSGSASSTATLQLGGIHGSEYISFSFDVQELKFSQ